jgi:flagellar biosynthesis/type III secretory pathway protein FliH
MPKGKAESVQAEATALVIPAEVEQELTLLRGFRDLVAERTGYALAVSALNAEMKDSTAEQRKASNEARKALRQNLETFIQNGDFEGYKKAVEEVKKTGEALKEARKPHMAKISPLRKGIKYIDNVAVPDSLKELGVTVQPAFSLSDWIKKAVETKKRR